MLGPGCYGGFLLRLSELCHIRLGVKFEGFTINAFSEKGLLFAIENANVFNIF